MAALKQTLRVIPATFVQPSRSLPLVRVSCRGEDLEASNTSNSVQVWNMKYSLRASYLIKTKANSALFLGIIKSLNQWAGTNGTCIEVILISTLPI
jgi:hypothetical protein